MKKGLDFDIVVSFRQERGKLTSCFLTCLFEQNILRNVSGSVWEEELPGRKNVQDDPKRRGCLPSNHPGPSLGKRGNAFPFSALQPEGACSGWEPAQPGEIGQCPAAGDGGVHGDRKPANLPPGILLLRSRPLWLTQRLSPPRVALLTQWFPCSPCCS